MDKAGMMLFDSNMNHPLNQLSWNDQMYMIAVTMRQFREFPLCGGGYDEEGLRFYDGVLGSLIRMRDKMRRMQNEWGMQEIPEYEAFVSKWAFQGDIYRVIGEARVYEDGDDEPHMEMPEIKWHGMIASWSSSYDFTTGFNHIHPDAKYTIIHANTGDSVGIDANKLGDYVSGYNPHTVGENEVIFPMKKEFVVEVYEEITPNEFKNLMESEVSQ